MMSDGIEKIVSPLRKAMSELDYGIPEYVFDSEDGTAHRQASVSPSDQL